MLHMIMFFHIVSFHLLSISFNILLDFISTVRK